MNDKPTQRWRKPMTRITFAAARRTVTSTLVACVLAVPQLAFAASEAGVWKVDPAKSKFNASSATLTIQRADGANATGGRFIVISGAGVYLVTGSSASDSKGLKPVDFSRMTQTGEAVLIGTNPRSLDPCGFKCRAGLPEPVRTVTFKVVNRGEQQIRDMLASDDQNW
jgi:hypothetical protein